MRATIAVGTAAAMVTFALFAQSAKGRKTHAKPENPVAAEPKPAATATPVETPPPEAAPPAAPAAAAQASASTSWSSDEDMMPAHQGTTFGAPFQLIVGVDRAFGLSIWQEKFSRPDGSSTTQSGTAINLLSGSDSGVDGPLATPRIAFDFAVVRNVTVGAVVGYGHRSLSAQSTLADGSKLPSQSSPSTSSTILGLRGGYAWELTKMFVFWPRLGFNYYTGYVGGGYKINGLLVNLEPTVVFTPVDHVGFTLGAIADLPLSGSLKDTTAGTSFTNKLMSFGIGAGILGYL
jgi:hypothetical protein